MHLIGKVHGGPANIADFDCLVPYVLEDLVI